MVRAYQQQSIVTEINQSQVMSVTLSFYSNSICQVSETMISVFLQKNVSLEIYLLSHHSYYVHTMVDLNTLVHEADALCFPL